MKCKSSGSMFSDFVRMGERYCELNNRSDKTRFLNDNIRHQKKNVLLMHCKTEPINWTHKSLVVSDEIIESRLIIISHEIFIYRT